MSTCGTVGVITMTPGLSLNSNLRENNKQTHLLADLAKSAPFDYKSALLTSIDITYNNCKMLVARHN